jgi:hypothetical protein
LCRAPLLFESAGQRKLRSRPQRSRLGGEKEKKDARNMQAEDPSLSAAYFFSLFG